MWSVTRKVLSRNFCPTITPKKNIVRAIKVSEKDSNSMGNLAIKSFKEIPGPSSLPLIGSAHHFLPGGKFYKMDRLVFCNELYKLYGPIVKLDELANQPTTIFLYDAESASKIFRGSEPAPQRRGIELFEIFRQKHNIQYQVGALVNGNGSEWRSVRTIANKAMMHPKIVSAAYSEVLNNVAMDAVDRFSSLRDENNMIPNFDEEVKLWAFESVGIVTLGRRLNSFRPDLPQDSYEKRLISLAHKTFDYIEEVDLRSNNFAYSGLYNKAINTLAELVSVINYFINDTIKNLESKNVSDISHTCTIEKMIHYNRDAALALAFDSIVAGITTVTQTILVFLYCLGVNTDKQDKLREEILSGNDRKPYLRACMKESSRIFPTSSSNGRITTKPYQILGYEVPEGTPVVFVHHVMCLMESQFPRAQEFIPERWLLEKDHPLYYGNAHPFAHSPFGFGSRSCIGRRIAELTMEAFIVNMFKNFDVKWEGPPPNIAPHTVNRMVPPIRFIFNNSK